ncbi:MAG TPA: SoxR reducing system RseC family protein [Gammaproteobacteria bacterium]
MSPLPPRVARRRVGRQDCLAVDGKVRAVGADGTVELELEEPARCAGCAGMCTWRRPVGPRRVRLASPLPLRPGDAVRVSLPAGHVLSTALLLHGLPLAALLGGALIGAAAFHTDAGTLAGAVAGVAAACWGTRSIRRRAEARTAARAELERTT